MSMKQTLTAATICALALAFNASANVAYDNEVTNTWFSVKAASANLDDSKWEKPKDGEVTKDTSVIKLDTDLTDPLIYKPENQSGNLAIVTARFTATANTADPVLGPTPQAALTVIVEGASTNWCGLVKGASENEWVKFSNEIPTVGNEYNVQIEFDLRQGQKRIRYSVGGKVLLGEGNTDGWYDNPKTDATAIASVSFAGTGDIGDFGGSNVVAAAAGFNGVNYETFGAAMAAARGIWTDSNPVVLYKDETYDAPGTKDSETIYVNANGHDFAISGEVDFDNNGNTYTITKGTACEAKIGAKYYSTLEKAIGESDGSLPIVVNKAIERDNLTIAKNLKIDPAGKLTCGTLTVDADRTLTLVNNALAVTTATIGGAVAGEMLTVKTLTGWNVVKLALAADAVITYDAAHVLQPLSVSSVTINGLGAVKVGDVVLKAEPSSWAANGLAVDKCLEVANGQLVVASVAKITEVTEGEGYDYTNGTVNVTATVKSDTATAVLTVVGWDGTTIKTATKDVTSGTVLTWDVAEVMDGALTQGGAYTYTIDVKVGDATVATKSGEFTAAKWGEDGVWFYADTAKDPDVYGGTWAAEPPVDSDGRYVVEDAQFNVSSTAGSNKFTRVDTKVSFESLVDGAPEAVSDAIGGFVATTAGWKALGSDGWVALSGGVAPAVNVEYVIRAEFDFPQQRVRFFVSADDGASFVVLSNAIDGAWVAWTKEQKTLQSVGFQGSGLLASINATVADKALFEVNGKKFDTLAEALAEAGTEGTNTIKLLTNVTIEPDLNTPGKYAIAPNNHEYMSGGKVSSEAKTIIVEGTGKPPVVRLNDSEMREVRVPGVDAPVRNTDKLRKFLEDNGIESYTGNDASSDAITQALTNELKSGSNQLKLWQDYALGVDKDTPVAPVTTPAGDTDAANITLAIPAVKEANYSGDYTIKYQVTGGGDPVDATDPSLIKIPVNRGTGTYTIKVLFTPATAQ